MYINITVCIRLYSRSVSIFVFSAFIIMYAIVISLIYSALLLFPICKIGEIRLSGNMQFKN